MKKVKSIKELASLIAKSESLKHEASIGDVREILSILSDLSVRHESVVDVLLRNGVRRLSK